MSAVWNGWKLPLKIPTGGCKAHLHLPHNALQLLPLRLPIELVHAAVADQRGKHLAEVIPGHDDRGPPDRGLLNPVLPDGHSLGIVADVHQSANDHLVVDGDLT